MLKITINEIIEEFGYNCREISDMIGIGYNQVLDLKNFKKKYSKKDILKINEWYKFRFNKIVYIDFKPQENRKIYKFEQRGVMNLSEYKRKKAQEQRRVERENWDIQRAKSIQEMFRR